MLIISGEIETFRIFFVKRREKCYSQQEMNPGALKLKPFFVPFTPPALLGKKYIFVA